MVGAGAPALGHQRQGQLLALAAGGVEHDGHARLIRPQVSGQGVEDAAQLLGLAHLLDFEDQVLALDARLEQFELVAELLPEEAPDLVGDGLLGGCREAGHRRRGRLPLFLGQLPDEARGVEVVRAEVVAPLGQAVGFVEDPGPDLALLDGVADRAVTELLGGDVQQAAGTVRHLLQHPAALGRGHHPVQSRGVRGVRGPLHSVDLVLHQRLQGRDHHRQQPQTLVPSQGRELEADGLSAASGQHGVDGPATQARRGDGPLQAAARPRIRRLSAKAVELLAKEARQQGLGVVFSLAPGAVRAGAGLLPQGREHGRHRRVLPPYPARQNRPSIGLQQPGGRVGEGNPLPAGSGERLSQLGQPLEAGMGTEGIEHRIEHDHARAGKRAERLEEGREASRPGAALGQLVQGAVQQRQQGVARAQGAQREPLVLEQPGAELRVGHRVVGGVLDQAVLLDQGVVGAPGEGDGREHQGVQGGLAQQGQAGDFSRQVGQVVVEQVVADDELSGCGEVVQPRPVVGARALEAEDAVAQHRTHVPDVACPGDLEVEEHGVGGQGVGGLGMSSHARSSLEARSYRDRWRWARGRAREPASPSCNTTQGGGMVRASRRKVASRRARRSADEGPAGAECPSSRRAISPRHGGGSGRGMRGISASEAPRSAGPAMTRSTLRLLYALAFGSLGATLPYLAVELEEAGLTTRSLGIVLLRT